MPTDKKMPINDILNLVRDRVLIKTERKSWGKITGHTTISVKDQVWYLYVGGPGVSNPVDNILSLITDQIRSSYGLQKNN